MHHIIYLRLLAVVQYDLYMAPTYMYSKSNFLCIDIMHTFKPSVRITSMIAQHGRFNALLSYLGHGEYEQTGAVYLIKLTVPFRVFYKWYPMFALLTCFSP